jgi:tripartite-type tricarboxylate transporter receptor subunit TctC
VPTLKEKGYPEGVMFAWYGFVAPAGTPKPIIEKLHGALHFAMQDPATREWLKKNVWQENYKGPSELAKFVKFQVDKFTKIAKERSWTILRKEK